MAGTIKKLPIFIFEKILIIFTPFLEGIPTVTTEVA